MARVLDTFARGLVIVAGLMLAVFTAIISYQVMSRYIDFVPRLFWTEEVSRFSFIWMTFLGAAAAVWYKTHFDIDIVPASIQSRHGAKIDVVVQIIIAAVGLAMIIGGIHFVEMGMARISTTSGIRMAWIHIAMPFAGASILLFALGRLWIARKSEPPANHE